MTTASKYILVLLCAIVFLRLPALFVPVLDVDEAIYGLFARIWFDGGIPYVDCVETKPLGIYAFYGAVFSLFGRFNMIAVHAVTVIVVGLTAWVICLICRQTAAPQQPPAAVSTTAFFAALFYVVFSTTYIPKVIATTIEPVMLLPICLQYYFWIRFEKERRPALAFLSGLAFGAACIFKYQAGVNLFVMLAYLGIFRPFLVSERSYLGHWRGFPLFIAGGLIPAAVMLGYIVHAGALDGFILWNVRGNADYISGGTAHISFSGQLFKRVLPYIASTALLWILAAMGMKRSCCSRPASGHGTGSSGNPENFGLLILLWFIFNIIPVSAGYRFYGHYFLLLLPPLSILAATVAAGIWCRTDRMTRAKFLILFWLVLPALGFSVARFYIPAINRAFGEDNPGDYRPIAEYIEKHTTPSDRIAAWGFAPLIYWYSERLPATRFFWSDLLVGRVPGRKGPPVIAAPMMSEAWEMFFADLDRHKPAYIIDTAPANLHDYKYYPISRYPQLAEYINSRYTEETRINGAVVYRRVEP